MRAWNDREGGLLTFFFSALRPQLETLLQHRADRFAEHGIGCLEGLIRHDDIVEMTKAIYRVSRLR